MQEALSVLEVAVHYHEVALLTQGEWGLAISSLHYADKECWRLQAKESSNVAV
jgi:hypothetical protein